MLELIRFHCGTGRFYAGFLFLSPWMVMMKAGIISNQSAKERMLRYFFGGMPIERFNSICTAFARQVLPGLVRPQALTAIRELQSGGTEVVLVSASAENWLKSWCDNMSIKLIATILEVKDGKLTGNLSGRNCHGVEKVERIRLKYTLGDYHEISCYGDTGGDRPMLSLGHKSFYKPFRDGQ